MIATFPPPEISHPSFVVTIKTVVALLYLNGLIDLLHLITLKQEQNIWTNRRSLNTMKNTFNEMNWPKKTFTTWISYVQTEAQTDQQQKVEKYKIDKYNHTI